MHHDDIETTYKLVHSPTHRLEQGSCPTCGKPLTAATGGSGDNGPKPGDLTLCFYCTTFLVFTEAGAVRLLTDEEVGELHDDNRIELMRVRRSLKAFWKDREAKSRQKNKKKKRQQSGFTLIEIAVVIAIAAVILGAVIGLVTSQIQNARAVSMRTKLDTIEAALTTFVARNARLPCPAVETLPPDSISYGVEANNPGTCAGTTTVGTARRGVLPFRSLGLTSDDASDVYLSRYTYVVTASATALTYQTIAGAQGSITLHDDAPIILGSGGNQTNACAVDPNDNSCNRRAIALVISHGNNAYGAFQNSGVRTAFPTTETPSPLEVANTDDDDAYIEREYRDIPPIYDDYILIFTPDSLLAPLIQDGAVPSARSVTNEKLREVLDVVWAPTISNDGALPASLGPTVFTDGWGQAIIYARQINNICGAPPGALAFTVRSRGPNRLDDGGAGDDITHTQLAEPIKAHVMKVKGIACL